jgi:hypothetical protein
MNDSLFPKFLFAKCLFAKSSRCGIAVVLAAMLLPGKVFGQDGSGPNFPRRAEATRPYSLAGSDSVADSMSLTDSAPPPVRAVDSRPVAIRPGSPAAEKKPASGFPPLIVSDSKHASDSESAPASGGGLFDGGLFGGFAGPVVTTVSALMVVLGLFGGLVWISRRYGGPARMATGSLPDDVFRHLGETTVAGKLRVSYLACGDRIVVVGQSAGGEPTTLTELTDPEEVRRVTQRCAGRPAIVGRRVPLDSERNDSRQGRSVG